MVALLLFCIGGLVILYLTRPQFRHVQISSAQFFEETPDAKNQTPRFRLSNLLLSRSFYVQLGVLIALLLALLLADYHVDTDTRDSLGVWVAVDTSASMRAGDNTEAAQGAVSRLGSHLSALDADVCVNVSRFHLSNESLLSDGTPAGLDSVLNGMRPTTLGTDLNLIRALNSQLASQADEAECRITHLVVITDQPAPTWVDEDEDAVEIIWRSVGTPGPNVGLTAVRRAGSGALGWDGIVTVQVAGYDSTPSRAVVLRDEAGTEIQQASLVWNADDRASVTFQLSGGGTYTLTLTETDAYALDDRVTIQTAPPQQISVDWRLNDRALPDTLGWAQDAASPDLIVLPASAETPTGETPALKVGNAYGQATRDTQIATFDETSPLLDGLNFDVMEKAGIIGMPRSQLDTMRPVMLNTNDSVWLAAARDPLRAYVPGLPQQTADENVRALSTTAFFNAVRWLLNQRELPPLYTLTTPAQPEISGTRVALHPGEGNTAKPRRSIGTVEDISATTRNTKGEPVWFLLVLLAGALALLERYLAVFGGPRWRLD